MICHFAVIRVYFLLGRIKCNDGKKGLLFFLLFSSLSLEYNFSLCVCTDTNHYFWNVLFFYMFLTFEIVMSVSLFNAGIICFIVLQKLYMI